jgi:ElaB/YqjD/DUF883 family membrane-anchored ribosome-binding protein
MDMAATARRKNASSTKNAGPATKRRRKRAAPRSRNAGRMASGTLSRAQKVLGQAVAGDAEDLRAEVGQLVYDLENRLDRLNALTKRGASHAVDGVNTLAYGAVSGLTDRVRKGAQDISDDAAKLGNGAIGRVVREIEARPLLTLAIAVGLGLAAGFLRRDEQ